MQAGIGVPGLSLHEPGQKLRSLCVAAILSKQVGRRSEVLKGLAYYQHQAPQQFHRSSRVAILQANLSQTQHVCRAQLMRGNLLCEGELEDLAGGRALAAGFQRIGHLPQQLGTGSRLGLQDRGSAVELTLVHKMQGEALLP